MPCTYDGFHSGAELAAMARAEEQAKINEALHPVKDELDKVTRLLCEVMTSKVPLLPSTVKRKETHMVRVSVELEKWWDKHQEMDKKRIEREEKERMLTRLEAQVRELREELK